MPAPANTLRRLRFGCLAALVCAALTTPPAAQAAADEQLAAAIAATQGSYLVYNFGPGYPAPLQSADGNRYELNNGGHLMIIKAASQRLAPRLLVDSHTRYQARCERTPGARTSEGLAQSAEIYTPVAAWQALGRPTIAVNANFFDVRGQTGGSWKTTGCSSPLGAYVDNTGGQGRANVAVTGTVPYAGKQALSGGDENWTATRGAGHPIRGGQRSGTAGTRRHRSAQRPRSVRRTDGPGVFRRTGPDVCLPGRPLHTGPDPGSVPRVGK